MPGLRRVVQQMRTDPGTLDGVTTAARARSALVAALPPRDVQRHIAALLAAVSSAYIDRVDLGENVHVADRLAEDRALQGIPLAALLEGFQAGRQWVMAEIFARSSALEPKEVFEGLMELDCLANQVQNRLVHVYRETELSLTRTTHAVRLQALRTLLQGGPVSGSIAGEAGLDARKRYHCVLADVSAPREARRFEATLSGSDGLCGMVDGYLCAVSGRLPEEPFEILLVATPAVPVSELAGAYRLCQTALVAARRRNIKGLRHLTSLALPVSVDSQPVLGRMLAAEHLATLDPADEFHQLLARTALAYLEHGARTDSVASALHVHPNTVKHRLRRMAELTAFNPVPIGKNSLVHAVRWWWALHSWLSPVTDELQLHLEAEPVEHRR